MSRQTRCTAAHTDQGVFTYLIEKLGVKDVQFAELLTLDADDLRALGDIYGVIFLFKYPTGEKATAAPHDGAFDHEAANDLFFAAQTIQNACGTQALISVLLNKDGEIDIGKELREFKEFAGEFPPEVRRCWCDGAACDGGYWQLAGSLANGTCSCAERRCPTRT